jgi:hypothetical protein
MGVTRTNRGAWRRSPILPRAMTPRGGPTVTAPAAWTEEAPEARRVPEAPSAPAMEEPGEPVVEFIEEEAEPVEAETSREEALVAPEQRVRMGGCLCSAVRYEVRGEPKLVGLCHCADCRKATGGYALHYADWPVSAVRLTGRLSTFHGRSFCPDCGSRVVHFSAHHTEVLLGTLDDPPNDLVPQREIWTVRREPWVQPVPGAEQFERDPA